MLVMVDEYFDDDACRSIIEATKFFAAILLNPRTLKVLQIDIEVDTDLEHEGVCFTNTNPRHFTIILGCGPNDADPIRTIAHEMVHVKQHVKKELDCSVTFRGSSFSIAKRWNGKVWKPKKNQHPYYDSPWEMEAFAREHALYDLWHKQKGIAA